MLGDSPLTSFTDSGNGATVANSLYSDIYRAFLSEHPWGFALKEVQLSRLSQTPDDETGYSYAFQLPSDMIRLWAIMPRSMYTIVDNLLYSNDSALLARYVYECAESQLPPYAIKAVEYSLAAEFAMPITEDLNKTGYYQEKYLMQLSRAKNIDSQGRPQVGIQSSPFIEVR